VGVSAAASQAVDWVGETASSAASTASDVASTAAGAVQDAASSAADRLQEAQQVIRRQARGDPLAAGLIAFGAGWLVSSLLPASRREQELTDQAKQVAQEKVQPVVSQVASEVSDNLREPAQQAMDSVKSTAQDAGQTVADKGRPAAQDVQGRAQDAAGTVRRRLRRRCAPPPRIGHVGDARSPRATTGCRGDGPWGARAARVGSASP
jgi:gas vesicle protein